MFLLTSVTRLESPGWLLLVAVLLLSVWILAKNFATKQLPGPVSLPVVGSLLSVSGKDMRKSMAVLAAKYGDIMQVDLGLQRTIVLNTFNAMKESLLKQGHSYVFRPPSIFADCCHDLGITSQNSNWTEHRRFILQAFRNLGVGNNRAEMIIGDAVSMLIKEMYKHVNRPTAITDMFIKTTSIIILRLVFGQSVSHDDPLMTKHIHLVDELTTLEEKSFLSKSFPFLKFVPGDLTRAKRIETLLLQLRDISLQWIAERKKTIHYDSEPTDFIEAYLQEKRSRPNSEETGFTEEMLAWHICALYIGGVDTAGSTLTLAIYRMVLHKKIQDKVHNEIDEVVGNRQPTLRDRTKMPYTEAVLSEVQRLSVVAPFSLPHTNNRESEIMGYTIPEGSFIMMNIHYAHRDPKVWPDPETFDPNRFLNSFGQFKTREELIPFGIGKRNCLGEMLARNELFLIFVGAMQHFAFRTPDGGTEPDPDGTPGLIVHPKPADIIIESRFRD